MWIPNDNNLDLLKDVRPLILSFITDIDDINNLRLTCKYLKTLAVNETVTLTTNRKPRKNKTIFLRLWYLMKNFDMSRTKLKNIYIPINERSTPLFSKSFMFRAMQHLIYLNIATIEYDNNYLLYKYLANLLQHEFYTIKNIILKNVSHKNQIDHVQFTNDSIHVYLRENEDIIKKSLIKDIVCISQERIFDREEWPKILLYALAIFQKFNIYTYLHTSSFKDKIIQKRVQILDISILNSLTIIKNDLTKAVYKIFDSNNIEIKVKFPERDTKYDIIATGLNKSINSVLNNPKFNYKYKGIKILELYISPADIPLLLNHLPNLQKITVLVNTHDEIINCHGIPKVKKYVLSDHTYVRVNY